ncbi:histidine triad nucleotide-binding protein [Histoplasma ohiense]|nr:histidine triad nucleotide-binding protein [Histoplasma ohiense (nom. inval.)]
MSRNSSRSSSPRDVVPGSVAEAPAPHRKEQMQSRNAFTELMAPKPQLPLEPISSSHKLSINFKNRDDLGPYIENPSSYSPSIVLYYNDEFVAVRDRYPKSSLHLLLLPREPTKARLHPFDAFDDPEFLQKVQKETKGLKRLAAAELRRMHSSTSTQEIARQKAMDADPPPDELPAGRDWEKEIMCGIHAHPSMAHLHIHVLSVDRFSPCLRHRKHYNSFSTPFFIDVEDFPLAKDDARRHPGREGYLKRDFECWRCGEMFGNKFQRLKAHLEEEFLAWRTL